MHKLLLMKHFSHLFRDLTLQNIAKPVLLPVSGYPIPVDIRRRFNVYKTSETSYRRLIYVETKWCVFWHLSMFSLMRKYQNFTHIKWFSSYHPLKILTWSFISEITMKIARSGFQPRIYLKNSMCFSFSTLNFSEKKRHVLTAPFMNDSKYKKLYIY